MIARFHGRLSEQTVYSRYLQASRLDERVAHDRLVRICFNDYDRSLALVAEGRTEAGQSEISAVARLVMSRDGQEAELALLVEDGYQGQGLGKEMVRRLQQVATDEGLQKVVAHILPSNEAMQALCRGLGFRLHPEAGPGKPVVAVFEPSRS
jgi:acetyltransferase